MSTRKSDIHSFSYLSKIAARLYIDICSNLVFCYVPYAGRHIEVYPLQEVFSKIFTNGLGVL